MEKPPPSHVAGSDQATAVFENNLGRANAISVARSGVGHDIAQRLERSQAPRTRKALQSFRVNGFVGH
jgi:hypothetical protein